MAVTGAEEKTSYPAAVKHADFCGMAGEMTTGHAGGFTCGYLKAGPKVWRVRIGRTAD